MSAKDYLARARRIDRQIDETRERLARMRAQLEGPVISPDGVTAGRGRWDDRMAEMIDLEARLRDKIGDMCRVKLEILNAIDSVDDDVLREVLELYYLDGLSWREVAERMHYSVRNVQVLHGKAIGRVEDCIVLRAGGVL